jgi:hypothetical protein
MDLRSLAKVELHLYLDCSLSYSVVSRLDARVTREEYAREFMAPTRCTDLMGVEAAFADAAVKERVRGRLTEAYGKAVSVER